MDHIGPAHSVGELEVLRAAAGQRMVGEGQDELDFGDGRSRRVALPVRSSRARYLWDVLSAGFTAVGFDKATGGDEVLKQLVLARLVGPTSKFEAIRALQEAGIPAPAYRKSRPPH